MELLRRDSSNSVFINVETQKIYRGRGYITTVVKVATDWTLKNGCLPRFGSSMQVKYIEQHSKSFVMKNTYGCDGISTRQHNEPTGNQDVWHYHLHVYPSYENDQLYLTKGIRSDPEDRSFYALY